MDKLLFLLVSFLILSAFTIFSNGQEQCYRAWLSGGFLLEQGACFSSRGADCGFLLCAVRGSSASLQGLPVVLLL